MLLSMTGFGKSEVKIGTKNISIEIKSLNNKQIDIITKLPILYKSKELSIRSLLQKELKRGKIEIFVKIEDSFSSHKSIINTELAKNYYLQIKELKAEVGERETSGIIDTIMSFPDIMQQEEETLSAKEWTALQNGIQNAICGLKEFRKQEGNALEEDIKSRILKIENLLEEVKKYEKNRVENISKRIRTNLNELKLNENIDVNRFEQELIYYLEKFDITEEKVRLKNHCKYFMQTVSEVGTLGKKLNFISQEMGREINTIGSKANASDIQKLVVQMKDELEKIKEQLMNIV